MMGGGFAVFERCGARCARREHPAVRLSRLQLRTLPRTPGSGSGASGAGDKCVAGSSVGPALAASPTARTSLLLLLLLLLLLFTAEKAVCATCGRSFSLSPPWLLSSSL